MGLPISRGRSRWSRTCWTVAPGHETLCTKRRRRAIALTREVEELIYRQRIPDCVCGGCDRFIGALEVCPFCRRYNRKRLPVFLVKYLTPLLTVLGIVFLFRLTAAVPHPSASIRDLGRRNNFAQVELRGRVDEEVRFYAAVAAPDAPPDSSKSGPTAPSPASPQERSDGPAGSLEFRLDDGTGVIKVRCYDDATSDLRRAGKIPGLGDGVVVRGSYQFRAKTDFIVLDSAHDIEIDRRLAEAPTPIRRAGDRRSGARDGLPVKVTGRVVRASYDRYSFVCVIEDGAGNTLEAALPVSMLELLGYRRGEQNLWTAEPRPGQIVTIDGTLEWSRFAKAFRVIVSSPERIGQVDSDTLAEHNR